MRLSFQAGVPGQECSIGPAPWFRLDGSLFGDGRLVARFDDRSQRWRVLPLERTADVVRIVPAQPPGGGSFFG